MKHIYRSIFTAFAVLGAFFFSNTAAQAQTQPSTDVIKLFKTTTPKGDAYPDTYVIKLDSYVTGTAAITTESKPVDIVLVLDVSGSMAWSIDTGTSYKARVNQEYTYDGYGNNTFYYKMGDSYYPVERVVEQDPSEQTYYYLYYTNSGNTRYLKGNSRQNNVYTDITSPTTPIWTTDLYNSSHNSIGTSFSYNQINGTQYYKRTRNGSTNYYKVEKGTGKTTVYINQKYFLKFSVENSDGTTTDYWLNGDGEPTTEKPAGVDAGTKKIWKGVLYESESGSDSKINILKEAVYNFIDIIEDDAVTNSVDHRISVVKFANDDWGTGSSASDLTEKNTKGKTQLVKNLTLANGGAESLKSAVEALATNGATAADYGLEKAYYVLKQPIPSGLTAERNKVVVMFTDGDPTHGSSFSTTVAGNAIEAAKDLKDSPINAKVYTIGIFTSLNNNEKNYMNWTSSNYPDAEGWEDEGDPVEEDKRTFFKNATNAAELSSIFEEIAHASTADTYPLTDASVSSIDIVSDDFYIDFTGIQEGHEADKISVHIEWCDGYDSESPDGFHWTKTRPTKQYAGDAPAVTVGPSEEGGEEDNKVDVTGFYYAKDDTFDSATKQYTQYGNWVGHRPNEPATSAHGAKLVYEFEVKLKETSEGGYFMPSNEISSGIYVQDPETHEWGMIKAYPLPTVKVPALCIIKKGLVDENTALFEVSGTSGDYKVLLTGPESGNETYAVIKNIKEGNYTVKERADWAWTYTCSAEGTGAAKDTNNNPYLTKKLQAPFDQVPTTRPGYISEENWTALQAITDPDEKISKFAQFYMEQLSDEQQAGYTGTRYCDSENYIVVNNAICLKYVFTNKPATQTILNGEAVVHNIFGEGGGSAEHGGVDEEVEPDPVNPANN